jgi:predicted ArsR family transcriptional regulator
MTAPQHSAMERDIQRLADALGDPTRRRIFFMVREAGEPQSKDDVAATAGIDRRLAGFHLDKLVEQGFLSADFARRTDKSGPGAGRPAKHYQLADGDLETGLQERHYEVLSQLLLKAMTDAGEGDPQEVLERVGREFGYEIGQAELAAGRRPHGKDAAEVVAGVVRLLSRYGFAARAEGDDSIRACACPFEEMAFLDPDRICGLDRAIWSGVLAAFAPEARIDVSTTRAGGDDACVAHVVTA